MANQLHCASCGTLTDRTALSPYRGWCEACRKRGGPPQPAPDAAALLSFGTHWTGQYAAARCPQCGAESSRWPWVEGRMAGDFESALSAHGLLAWAARHQRECAARAAGTEAGR